jgi:hypothetical protein
VHSNICDVAQSPPLGCAKKNELTRQDRLLGKSFYRSSQKYSVSRQQNHHQRLQSGFVAKYGILTKWRNHPLALCKDVRFADFNRCFLFYPRILLRTTIPRQRREIYQPVRPSVSEGKGWVKDWIPQLLGGIFASSSAKSMTSRENKNHFKRAYRICIASKTSSHLKYTQTFYQVLPYLAR